MFSSLLSSRDLFTQKLLEDTHVSIFQKTLNIFKYLNNSFYISYSEQLKGTGRQSCVSLCPRTKIEEERAHVSAPSIPKLYSRAYMCIPLYKVKNRIPQAHVFSLNVQKRMSARIYVCLSLRSKTNWEQSAHLSTPKPHSKIHICVPSKNQKEEDENVHMFALSIPRSHPRRSCASFCPRPKKVEEYDTCVCSEPSKTYLYKAYICPLYQDSKRRNTDLCVSPVSQLKQNQMISKHAGV
jgi:hypothetical protein